MMGFVDYSKFNYCRLCSMRVPLVVIRCMDCNKTVSRGPRDMRKFGPIMAMESRAR